MLIERTQPQPGRQQDPALSGRTPEPKDLKEAPYDAWMKICVPAQPAQKHVCGLAYRGISDDPATLISAKSPLIAVTVRAVDSGGDARPVLLLRTRLGLLLPAGLQLQIDNGRTLKAAFRSCHASSRETGCIVPIRLDGPLLRGMRNGLVLKVTAKTLKGDIMDQNVSLLGITNALNAMNAEEQ